MKGGVITEDTTIQIHATVCAHVTVPGNFAKLLISRKNTVGLKHFLVETKNKKTFVYSQVI